MATEYQRGWLGTPAMTRLLKRLQPDVEEAVTADAIEMQAEIEPEFAEEIREREIRQRNEETFNRGILNWFRKTDEVSR